MPGTLPLVRGGVASALYNSTRRIIFDTGVTLMGNGTEQRWKRRAPLFEFDLVYTDLNSTDKEALKNFLATQGGMDALDWSMSFTSGGSTVTYNNMTFLDDALEVVEREPQLYNLTLRMRQTQNKSYTIPSVSAIFPTLGVGAFTELPYGPGYRSLTSVNESRSGQRYSYKWFGAGLTGFPTGQLHHWNLANPVVPDTDVALIEQFFTWAQGRLQVFSLTPEDGSTYTKCRFDSDILEIRYVGPQQASINLPVIEIN